MQNQASGRLEEKRLPSPLPPLITGGFWIVYALFFPLYRIGDFLLAAALSAVVFLVCRRLCPARTVLVPVPEVFAYTGDETVDALLRDGRETLKSIAAVCQNIDKDGVRRESDRACAACGKIFDYVAQNPKSAPQIRRFVSYHLPTVLKMLTSYERMEEQGIAGENISDAMGRVEGALTQVADAFEKQLDKLFAGESLDISTDITVLEGMLSQEGLSGNTIQDVNRRKPQ